jgi:hypothetical protein
MTRRCAGQLECAPPRNTSRFNVIAAAASRLFEMGKGAKEDDGGLGVGFGELPRVTRRGAMPTVAHHRRD